MNVKWFTLCKEFKHHLHILVIPSEFYSMINIWGDRWFDTSHLQSLVWYFTPVNSCMARFTSAVTSVDSGQMERGNSSIPHPLVNATEAFTLHVIVCSITRSQDNPVQNISLLWITWNSFWNICYTSRWVFGSSNIVCNYMYDDFAYRWCPDAAKTVSFYEQPEDATSSG